MAPSRGQQVPVVMRLRNDLARMACPLPDFRDEREHADFARIIPAMKNGGEHPLLGRIEVLRHGGEQRPVITRGAPHMRFRMPSAKTGMTEVGEGRGEELLTMQCEVDGNVLNYKCHPYRFEIALGEKPFTYRPDLAILWRNGKIEIVEVKRTIDDLTSDDRIRLGWVREFVRRCGWQFNIRYLEEIRGSKYREHNVARIFGRRALVLSRSEQSLAKSIRASGAPIEWGRLSTRLAEGDVRHGNAVVECLIAKGWFTVDFDAAFTAATILTPTRHVPRRSLPGFERMFA